jgi:hypothetical protein
MQDEGVKSEAEREWTFGEEEGRREKEKLIPMAGCRALVKAGGEVRVRKGLPLGI